MAQEIQPGDLSSINSPVFAESALNAFQIGTLSYGYSDNLIATDFPAMGSKSLFNEYSIFRFTNAAGDYNRLYDSPGKTLTEPSMRNPTAQNIITWCQDNPVSTPPYSYADFLYCTYYGLIPNNYLITLRRYPIPMLDNLKTSTGVNIPPVAQAVTWMGEEPGNKLSEIMKFACGLAWKEIEAKVQEVTGNEKGFESGPFAGAPGGNILAGIQGFLNPTEYSGLARAQTDYSREVYGSEGPYANKVYGPVNVVNKTLARDQGLHFDHEITLNFNYALKVHGNINPKMAMLDIMSNMLTLTYNNAKFWGGAIRYFPQHPQVGFFGDQNAFYSGDVSTYIDSVVGQFQKLGNTFMDSFSKLLQDPLSALKELAMGGAKFAMGKIAAKDRPQILAMRSLLTGAPVGEWHLVLGNPLNPIAMIGNLVCTDMEMEMGDVLGADDFPTEIKFTVKLKHGKPRDKGDIESMFNLGNGRMYYGIKDDVIFSSTHNSNIDTSGKNGEAANNTIKGSRSFTPFSADQIKEQENSFKNLKSPGKSMWGKKFTPEGLSISKTWAGGATKTEATTPTKKSN